jgi:hypothetical protein
VPRTRVQIDHATPARKRTSPGLRRVPRAELVARRSDRSPVVGTDGSPRARGCGSEPGRQRATGEVLLVPPRRACSVRRDAHDMHRLPRRRSRRRTVPGARYLFHELRDLSLERSVETRSASACRFSAADGRPQPIDREAREVHEGTRGGTPLEPLARHINAQAPSDASADASAGYRFSRQPQALKRSGRATLRIVSRPWPKPCRNQDRSSTHGVVAKRLDDATDVGHEVA